MRLRLGTADVAGLVALGLLAVALWQMSAPPPVEPGPAAIGDGRADVRPGHEWLGLYFRGRKVGFVHLDKAHGPEGWRFQVETRLRVGAGTPDVALDLDATLTAELALTSFEFTVVAGDSRLRGHGRVDGRRLELRTESAGDTTTRTLELARPPVLRQLDGLALAQRPLNPGDRFTLHAFDPITQSDQEVEIEVLGTEPLVVMGAEVQAVRLRQRTAGLTLEAWITPRGEVLKQELGLGLSAVRESEAEARFAGPASSASGPGADLPAVTAIPVEGLPARLDGAVKLALRLEGVDDLAGFELDGDRQALTGDRLVVTREVDLAGIPPGRPEPAEPMVQSDHPEIVEVAEELRGGEVDSVVIAGRAMAWIRRRVTQRNVPGVPSALETLRNGAGDCNEHAVLFAALLRAAGVPTRIVAGLAYRDGRFAYHAWNEVRGREGWVTADPTWGQIPADAGHVRFVRGGLARQVELLRLMGRLRLTEIRLEP